MITLRKIIFSLGKVNKSEIINSKFLKETFNVSGHVILNFINTSLSTGLFPDQYKISTLTPIPKVNNTSNFRPINNIPTLEKVLELAVYDQLVTYFNENNLFIEN